MTTAPLQSASEEAYAEYLTLAGLAYQYEQRWGTAQPDFTISRPGTLTEPIAIADIKDVCHSDPDEALLAAGEEIHIQRNPALKTRRLIHSVWRQFEACADYPCILGPVFKDMVSCRDETSP